MSLELELSVCLALLQLLAEHKRNEGNRHVFLKETKISPNPNFFLYWLIALPFAPVKKEVRFFICYNYELVLFIVSRAARLTVEGIIYIAVHTRSPYLYCKPRFMKCKSFCFFTRTLPLVLEVHLLNWKFKYKNINT